MWGPGFYSRYSWRNKCWQKWSVSLGGFSVKPSVVSYRRNNFPLGVFTSSWLFRLLGCLLQVAHPVQIPSPGVYNQRGFVCGQLGRCVLKSFVHIYCYLFCKLKMEMYFKSLFFIQLVIVLRLIKWDHGVLGVFPMDSPFRTLYPQDPSGASHYRSL